MSYAAANRSGAMPSILLISANLSLGLGKKEEDWTKEWVPKSEYWPKYEPDDGPLTQEQYDKINFDLKVATSKEIINKLHDRFFHTKDHSYNFTDFGLV